MFMHKVFILLAVLAQIFSVAAWQSSSSSRASSRMLNMISDGRRALIGGNWKLNPTTVKAAETLVKDLTHLVKDIHTVDTAIFPPFPLLPTVKAQLGGSNIKLGAQDCFYETSGAYTGAVSTELLKEVGASYVLVGHSERRTIFKECDKTINKKVKKVLKDGLLPVCAIQLLNNLKDVSPEEMLKVVLAYEPVWAIGTGLVCPKEVAQEVHHFIRSLIAKKYGQEIAKKVIIQYGGSVNANNVKELMAMPDIDGALVGGASLTADSFAKIVGYEKL
eukprot:scaffold2089_cov189-Ochromonas_danica.AAC.5